MFGGGIKDGSDTVSGPTTVHFDAVSGKETIYYDSFTEHYPHLSHDASTAKGKGTHRKGE